MYKRVLSLILAFALCFGMTSALAVSDTMLADGVRAELTGVAPANSSNKGKQDYTTWASTVKSYLYENPEGGLTRVEYINDQVIVEDYDSAFQCVSSKTIAPELPVWGGFFAGDDANFLIFGQSNPAENDSTEVIRIVKYDKSWNRIDQASLKGANTVVPFEAGSLRCDEYGGYLYIRTCHKMYKSSDGLNHQANVTIAVRERDMTVTDSFYDVMNSGYGYVSHSFNQFVIVDENGYIVTLDHGDAYPRSVVYMRYYQKAGQEKFRGQAYSDWCSAANLKEFAGATGDNTTGASVGGLAETSSCYIMAYNYDNAGGRGDRYPYFHYMDIATGRSWSVQVGDTPGSTTPVLAPTGLNGGYMLWNGKSGSAINDTLYYLHYGADGKPESVTTAKGVLSDCQPIFYNGKVVWYTTDRSAPVFYQLDASGITATLANSGASAPTNAAAATPSASDSEATTPSTSSSNKVPLTPSTDSTNKTSSTPSKGSFNKETSTSSSDKPDPSTSSKNPSTSTKTATSFSDVQSADWFKSYVDKATSAGLMVGTGDNRFDPKGNLTISQAVVLAYQIDSKATGGTLPQASGAWYMPYYQYCLEKGIISASDVPGSSLQQTASRYDMIRILNLAVPSERMAATKTVTSIPDVTENSAYGPLVYKWYRAGILSGDDTGRFNASSSITRAEVAVILCQIDQL